MIVAGARVEAPQIRVATTGPGEQVTHLNQFASERD